MMIVVGIMSAVVRAAQSRTTQPPGGEPPQEPPGESPKWSPRHQEWAAVKHDSRAVQCFIVYPQASEKTPVVLIIHENQGLTAWVRGLADKVAEAGYIAVAPDLLSGMAPNDGDTRDFSSPSAATEAIYKLPQAQVTADLNAAADYALRLPACNGKLAVAGFCWGGSQAFEFATNRPALHAGYVFYGAAPTDLSALQRIRCPIYGFYAGDDARVTSTVEQTTKQMWNAGKSFEPRVYPKAGHAFMRLGETAQPGDPNRTARQEAWERWLGLLKRI